MGVRSCAFFTGILEKRIRINREKPRDSRPIQKNPGQIP